MKVKRIQPPMKRLVFLSLYYVIGKNLPLGFYPLGRYFCGFRSLCLRHAIPFGSDNRIQREVSVSDGRNVSVGSRCQINQGVRLNNVQIGNDVLIGAYTLFLGNRHLTERTDIPMAQQGYVEAEQIKVEDDVWIGTRCIIMPGVHLHTGCIVGAGAVVTKDCEAFGVYGGVPAKLIKSRKPSS